MKKRIIIGTICIMLLSTLFHSVYKWIPCTLTAILFPVNESIWEHGKMIVMAFVTWSLIERYILKDETNVVSSNFITCVLCILLVDLLFSPVYFYILKTHDNVFITILIYTVCVAISLIIRELFLKREKNIKIELMGCAGFAVLIIVFAFLTYYPINLPIFYDYNKRLFGIPTVK